ncbi:MAG: GNAT family N-acetyltransferase, partial [Gammaproteobacteria bacterium]|nr:GNAT family N-acetyltransferase [Gammaproteobacteria bacterium]
MEVLPIGIEHAGQFNETIMAIASEELFAIHPENLSAKSVYRFVERQVIDGAPMFVALEDDRVVGWCEISLSDLEYSEHSGVLSMGVLPGFRNRGVGSWL